MAEVKKAEVTTAEQEEAKLIKDGYVKCLITGGVSGKPFYLGYSEGDVAFVREGIYKALVDAKLARKPD